MEPVGASTKQNVGSGGGLWCVAAQSWAAVPPHERALEEEEKVPEYQVSEPYLNQVQRYELVKMAKNLNGKKIQACRGVSLQECVIPKPKMLES